MILCTTSFLLNIFTIVLYTSIIWLFASSMKLMYKDNTAYLKMIWGNAMTNAGIKFPTVTKRRERIINLFYEIIIVTWFMALCT